MTCDGVYDVYADVVQRLGVRDLTYKMAFLATTVIPQDAQVLLVLATC